MTYCSACGQLLAQDALHCQRCGAPVAGVAKPALTGERPISQAIAIVALLLNILVWPGLGSLVVGEKVGWSQGFLFLIGLIGSLVLIGIPFAIGAWIWGLVTGVRLLERAAAQERAARGTA